MIVQSFLTFFFIKLALSKTVLNSPITPVILYGAPARIEDFPFFAGTEFCGASIISERWLLTAAHCVEHPHQIRNNSVYVGGERKDNSIQLRYDYIFIHPKYGKGIIYAHDIALLRLQTPLRFSSKVKPVKLPENQVIRKQLMVIGRGFDETNRPSVSLMKMNVTKLSDQKCINTALPYKNFILDKTIICGMKSNGPGGICSGDSGSPLFQGNTVVGIVSFFFGEPNNCHSTRVSFYTNVAAFVPWIKATIGEN